MEQKDTVWSIIKRRLFRTPTPLDTRSIVYMWAILPMNSLMMQIMLDLLPLFKLTDLLQEQVASAKDQVGNGTMTMTLTFKDTDLGARQKIKRMLKLMSYNELSTAPTYYADSIEVLSVWRYHDPSQFDIN
jgi:hypothetical protein